jgi:hypothetical protein
MSESDCSFKASRKDVRLKRPSAAEKIRLSADELL